jgi:hypothetical protein
MGGSWGATVRLRVVSSPARFSGADAVNLPLSHDRAGEARRWMSAYRYEVPCAWCLSPTEGRARTRPACRAGR